MSTSRKVAAVNCARISFVPLIVLLASLGHVKAETLTSGNAHLRRTNLLQFIDGKGQVCIVHTIGDWERRKSAVLEVMQQVMGPLPGAEKRCPLDVAVEEEKDCGTYLRQFLTYRSEPGCRVPAYLLMPKEVLRSHVQAPAVLCLHQTHALGQKVVMGLGDSPNDEYGVELVERGYVCLAPAYPRLANYWPDLAALGYQSGTMKAIWDNFRGLDVLESLPFVRRGKFGAIGHSLGGHNAIYTAAFDPRIAVVAASCGLDSYADYMNGDIRGWTSDRYMPRLLDYPLGLFPFDFHEIVAALAPRPCLINAPIGDTNFHWWSVDRINQAAKEIYTLYGEPEQLRVEHPSGVHAFSREMREAAYSLFDQELMYSRMRLK